MRQEHLEQLDIREIIKILPHRYPFLLVDKIVELDREAARVLGVKNVTFNESFFQGHFPGAPIMPGVLILEALAQTGAVLLHLSNPGGKFAVLLNINNAKFRRPVKPGDVLHLKGEALHVSARGGKIHASALVDGQLAAQAEIGFAWADKNHI